MLDSILNFINTTGIAQLINGDRTLLIQTLIMYVIIGALFYLAIVKKFEPLLLLPIAFGMLLANLPGANLVHIEELYIKPEVIDYGRVLHETFFIWVLSLVFIPRLYSSELVL